MSGNHKHRYKNSALDSVELRRRREEEGMQLRKQKRDQQLSKRRNVNVNQVLPDDDPLQVIIVFYILCNYYVLFSLKATWRPRHRLLAFLKK